MITNVTFDAVSILEVRDGENWRRAYVNSEVGRDQLKADFPEAYEELCGEDKPWGTEPTVFPAPEPEPAPEPAPEPTMWDELDAAYLEGVNVAYD